MTVSEFEEILQSDIESEGYVSDRIFRGLIIIRKYIPDADIKSAEHDMVYSVSAKKLVQAGIVQEDVVELNKLRWITDDDCLAHNV